MRARSDVLTTRSQRLLPALSGILLLPAAAFLMLLLLLQNAPVQAQDDVLYVDDSAGGVNDGSSWADAYTSLQDALDDAESGDEIWVAAGVYYPDEGADQTDDDREETFELLDGVEIYGGFAATETLRTERDWESNLTVLSGDIEQDDDVDGSGVVTDTTKINGNNAYHVVTGSGTDDSAVLDGFTITAGQANDAGNIRGGGMVNDGGSPGVANVVFSGNFAAYGGGMGNDDGSPTLTNVTFSGNHAVQLGGGMDNDNGSSPALTNVTFSGNEANAPGGGMANDNSSPVLTNVTFHKNNALANGGGMYSANGSVVTMTNVTFSENVAGSGGGGLYNGGNSEVTLTDVTFSDNQSDGNGGGMLKQSGSPILTNVTFSGNRATGNGGGMWNSSGNSILDDATFVDNEAGNDGGAIYNLATLYISDSRIADNRTADASSDDGGNGGGIFNDGVMHIAKSQVEGNVTGDGYGEDEEDGGDGGAGGGIYNSGTLNIIATSITGNQTGAGGSGTATGGDGGGIFSSGIVHVFDGLIGENQTGDGGSGQSSGGRAGRGGGLFNVNATPVSISSSSVISNSTGASAQDVATQANGGGVYHGVGTMTVLNSTVSGNEAEGHGGGFYHTPITEVGLYNVTVAGNRADADENGDGDGGGLFITGAATLYNSIVAANSDGSPTVAHADCSLDDSAGGGFEAARYNLIGDDTGCDARFDDDPGNDIVGNLVNVAPGLTALGDYGGPAPTHALVPQSPARDAGDPGGCVDAEGDLLVDDQRGEPRPETEGARCDIGAVEYTLPVVSVDVAPASVLEDSGEALTVTFTRTRYTAGVITATFDVGGSATVGADYVQSGAESFDGNSGSVSFGDGVVTRTLRITPTVDHTVEPDETVMITLTGGTDYVLGMPDTVTGTITDDDSAGMLVSSSGGLITTEAGGTDTFTVTLQSEPTATVTVNLTSDDLSEGTVSPATLTFNATNWQTPQTVTVTGVDDDEDDGDQPYTIETTVSSDDPNYDGIEAPDVGVTNLDDEEEYRIYLPQVVGSP